MHVLAIIVGETAFWGRFSGCTRYLISNFQQFLNNATKLILNVIFNQILFKIYITAQ